MNNHFHLKSLFPFILIFSLLLLFISCKESEAVFVVKQLNSLMEKEILSFQDQEKNPPVSNEEMFQMREKIKALSDKKWTEKNRFIYFYNEGLFQTLFATHLFLHQSSGEESHAEKKEEGDQETLKALKQGLECYHECFRIIAKNPHGVDKKDQQVLKVNSEFLHQLINQLDLQQKRQEQESSSEEKQEKEGSSSDQKESKSGDPNEQKSDKEKGAEQPSQESSNDQKEASAPNDNRLSQQKMNDLLENKNDQQEQATTQSEQKGNEKESEKALSPELLQAILEEQQRNEEYNQFQSQEGYNHVDKDW